MFWTKDNFLEDPHGERQKALDAEYQHLKQDGEGYRIDVRGISLLSSDEAFRRAVEEITGDKISQYHTIYRRYLDSEEHETYIHSDANLSTYTGVVYLNTPDQCFGGTAFWQHKRYGLMRAPTEEFVKDFPGAAKDLFDELHADGADESQWQMLEMVPMIWNRLLLFDSTLYHSRYPKRAFGEDLPTARLVKVIFAKV